MEFKDNQAIYLQIATYMCEQILRREIVDGDKVSSIREMAVKLQVNPNTVQRAYDFLESEGIIIQKRGIGFYAADNARTTTLNLLKEQFLRDELPALVNKIQLLDLTWKELEEMSKRSV